MAWTWAWEGHKTPSPSGSVLLQNTQESEHLRPGMCMKCRAHLGQCPSGAPWSLSSVNLGSTRCLGLWQAQCGPPTVSNPHTCEQYLFAVSLPPYKTTEQVSLSKWPPLPPHVRAEIRHCKQRKPNFFSIFVTDMFCIFCIVFFLHICNFCFCKNYQK